MNTSTIAINSEVATDIEENRPMVKEIREIVNITDQDKDAAKRLVNPELPPSYEDISPGVAAALFVYHNKHNRGLKVAKATEYRNGMRAGEWKRNHQGLAFYPNGNIADGQHRCCAIAMSGVTVTTLVVRDFDKESIDTIDLGAARTAGDALAMGGVENAQIKASIAKSAEEYLHKYEFDTAPKFRLQQVEGLVMGNGDTLDTALDIANDVMLQYTEKVMTLAATGTAIYLLLRGGYDEEFVRDFFTRVATGEDYAESPACALHEQLHRAALPKTRDRFTPASRLAHICKGAQQWRDKKSVKKVTVGKKESLPAPGPILGVNLDAA
jgi:hypothetical protein